MAYTYEKQKTGQRENDRASAGRTGTTAKDGIPNSTMLSLLHQDHSAEAEADRLSQGISASAPDAVKREMGARLGADLSSVNMHTGANSALKANRMGARAMAQGNDIYFGQGGFDPEIAAHELVHTVQQGAVQGDVSQTVPTGSVQLWPFGKKSAKKDSKEKTKELSKKEKRLKEKIDFLFKISTGLVGEATEKSVNEDKKTFYIEHNLKEKYIKEGYSEKDARIKAFEDCLGIPDEEILSYRTYKKRVKKKDTKKFENIRRNLNEEEVIEVLKRRRVYCERLLKQFDALKEREGNPTDKEKLDKIYFMADKSIDAVMFDIYDYILGPTALENEAVRSAMLKYQNSYTAEEKKRFNHVPKIASSADDTDNKYIYPGNASLEVERMEMSFAHRRKKIEYIDKIMSGHIKDTYDQDDSKPEKEVPDSGRSIFLDDAVIVSGSSEENEKPVAPEEAKNDNSFDLEGDIPLKGEEPAIEDNLNIAARSNKSSLEEDDDNYKANKDYDPLSRLNEMDPVAKNDDLLLNLPGQAGPKSSGGSKAGSIDAQIEELRSREGGNKPMTKDQQTLLQAFEHAKRANKTNNTIGGVTAGAGGIGLALGVVAASGPLAPVTAAAMGLAGITGGIGSLIFDKSKKKHMKHDIVLAYLGKNSWEEIENLVRKKTNNPKMSSKVARGVYLHSLGLGYNRDEAFKIITKERADFLIKKAEGNDSDSELARIVVSKMGIERKNGLYAKGAAKLLASKLS